MRSVLSNQSTYVKFSNFETVSQIYFSTFESLIQLEKTFYRPTKLDSTMPQKMIYWHIKIRLVWKGTTDATLPFTFPPFLHKAIPVLIRYTQQLYRFRKNTVHYPLKCSTNWFIFQIDNCRKCKIIAQYTYNCCLFYCGQFFM